MPGAGKARHLILVFLFGLLASTACFSQPVPDHPSTARVQTPVIGRGNNPRIASTEICGNNIDDDGNGLIDDKDFSCYYNSPATAGCLPNKIIWSCTIDGLYWGDPETGVSHFVGNTSNTAMLDLAWASNGRLYGIDGTDIFEIDPGTGNLLFLGRLKTYHPANSLTADAQGNLYMTALSPSNAEMYLIKYSLATMQQTVIVALTPLHLSSAGDLTFLNGYLYMTGENNEVARIDPNNGSVQVFPVHSAFRLTKYGLITLGDGYLYTTHLNKVYRMDPATMQIDAAPFFSFPVNSQDILGLSNYTEQCNGPSCHDPGILVTIASAPPYCERPGISLKATGSGIIGPDGYEWTLPDGTKTTGAALLATASGTYTARYHNVPDNCGHDTSFSLLLIPTVRATLGNDTILCPGTSLTLMPKDPANITSYYWQDGATSPSYLVTQPGVYTLEASNVCGVLKDTIVVQEGILPEADIGKGSDMCPFDSLELKNYLHRQGFHYSWQDGSTRAVAMARGPGIYWVDVSTECGTVRDSIIINPKKYGCDLRVAVPNAFSPGGDGHNELFRPVITGPLSQYEFSVYNRWGKRIFHTTSRYDGWDGKINGNLQPEGIYVWTCVYSFNGRQPEVQKGTVLLIR